MDISGWKRVKHGQLPGDVPKAVKIAFREGKTKNTRRAKAFNRAVIARTRAQLKERTRALIEGE